MWGMSDLEPRGDRRLTRREREDRAYKLVLATGALGAVAVGAILAVLDIIGGSLPLLAAILAVICFVMLRRMLGGR
jgi:hypothetical protein